MVEKDIIKQSLKKNGISKDFFDDYSVEQVEEAIDNSELLFTYNDEVYVSTREEDYKELISMMDEPFVIENIEPEDDIDFFIESGDVHIERKTQGKIMVLSETDEGIIHTFNIIHDDNGLRINHFAEDR